MDYKICGGKGTVGCGELKPLEDFSRDSQRRDGRRPYCRPCDSARSSRNYRKNNNTVRRYLEANRERIFQYQRQYYEANRELVYARHRVRDARVRAAVLAHYGQACACCGSTDQLAIDHVNGDGRDHRMEVFGYKATGPAFYRWLIRQGFPGGFQVLCGRCNSSKANTPGCRLDHAA